MTEQLVVEPLNGGDVNVSGGGTRVFIPLVGEEVDLTHGDRGAAMLVEGSLVSGSSGVPSIEGAATCDSINKIDSYSSSDTPSSTG